MEEDLVNFIPGSWTCGFHASHVLEGVSGFFMDFNTHLCVLCVVYRSCCSWLFIHSYHLPAVLFFLTFVMYGCKFCMFVWSNPSCQIVYETQSTLHTIHFLSLQPGNQATRQPTTRSKQLTQWSLKGEIWGDCYVESWPITISHCVNSVQRH